MSPVQPTAQALAVCAHLRFTTEELLADILGHDQAAELFAWLRDLPFIERGPRGLFPHDLAREVLDADLRWRDRATYQTLHRALTRCASFPTGPARTISPSSRATST